MISGGGGGIRTHGRLAPTTVFKTVTIDHSDTPPGSFSIAKRGQNQNTITTGYSEFGQPDSGLAVASVPLDSR